MSKKTSGYTAPNTGIQGDAAHPTQNQTQPGNVTQGQKHFAPHYGSTGAGGAGAAPDEMAAPAVPAANLPKKGRPKGTKVTSIADLRALASKLK